MISGKTRDGIRLSTIVKMVSELAGVDVRTGTKHPFMLLYSGLRPCPVAESSDAKTMIAPWLEGATGYSRKDIYSSFRAGDWYI